jgi:hypothetical protein
LFFAEESHPPFLQKKSAHSVENISNRWAKLHFPDDEKKFRCQTVTL